MDPAVSTAPHIAPRPHPALRTLALFATLVLLGACRTVPIPVHVDLVPHLGEHASGTTTVEIGAGAVEDGPVARYPDDTGVCVPIDDPGVRLEGAAIDYDIAVTYDGPPLAGSLRARIHLAGAGVDLWTPERALGEAIEVDLAGAETRLSGSAALTPEQVAAVNEGEVCLGVELRAEGLSVPEGGVATIAYDVQVLAVRAAVSVF